jgi:hypothetical protein
MVFLASVIYVNVLSRTHDPRTKSEGKVRNRVSIKVCSVERGRDVLGGVVWFRVQMQSSLVAQ